jgi:cytochrome P450
VIRTLFGRLPEGELEQLARAIDARRRYIDHAFLSLLPVRESLPTPVRRGYRRAMAELESAIGAAIAARRASPGERTDLVSLLLDARGEDGEPLSDRDVRDEVLTLSITGFETLGDALSWTWYLLALHPACYERLVRELDAELEGRRPRVEDLPRLRYARQVLAESLRLYPPTWVYVRTALAADVLPSGAGIEAGAKLYLSPYVTQRDPRHFPEPERFDPGRFEPDAVRARPKLAYFPFGSGPHVCIGEAFARMEAGLTLARLAQRFRLELVDRREVVPDPRITLSPREPIRMLVVERARSVTAPRRPSGGRAAAR